MLRELKITSLALIETLHLIFSGRTDPAAALTVLTGETGAGKSIILQGLNLLAGCKATETWIRTGSDTASVEAFFEITPDKKDLKQELQDRGFTVDDSLILKRIISRHGRSRYFINDSMATAALAEFICENLFSVASQHEHQVLLHPRNHLNFIDSVGELWPLREKFSRLFSSWKNLREQLDKLAEQLQDRDKHRELLSFQLREIMDVSPVEGEDLELEAERKIHKSSDTLMELGQISHDILSDSVAAGINQVRKNLEQMTQFDDTLDTIAERIASAGYELDDLALQLGQYLHNIPSNPNRLEEIEVRIDLLQKLKRKYGGRQLQLSEVLAHAKSVERELADLDTSDQRVSEMKKELMALEKKLTMQATDLSRARKKAATQLEKDVSEELAALSFSGARFKVEFNAVQQTPSELTQSGWDRVEFMFSANPGEPVKPLVRIASGGELSRLLLGLKCILARRDQVDTVIFDEVDAGIGGQAAEDIALKIKELSLHHQVLCITHLPQIAARADQHFKVDKIQQNQRTLTEISQLDEESRLAELARMLAGAAVTRETLEFARDLLRKGKDQNRLAG